MATKQVIVGRVNTHVAESVDLSDKTMLSGEWSVNIEDNVLGVRRRMRQLVDKKAEGETYSAEDFTF